MPAMKLTPNAAMRARDVSRPRAEHLAEAEAAEASAAAGSRARTGDAANQARGGDKAKTPRPTAATAAVAAAAAAAAAAGRGRRAGGTAQVPATQARPRVTLRSRQLPNTASEIRSAMITKDLVPLEGLWRIFRGGCGGLAGRVTR